MDSPDAGTPRILVVDDIPVNVRLLVEILDGENLAVRTAASGDEALAILHHEPIDLILLDVLMPGMDGHAVCRAIRSEARFTALPVIMVTSLDAKEERVKGLEAGADDFLSKPIHRPELLARVRSLLRIKRLYDETQRQASELRAWSASLEERIAQGVAEVERLSRLKRFFSPALAESIVRGGADDPLKSRRREIAVVYLDLRGFTSFAELYDPEDVMSVLADYHAEMGKVVLAFEATLERFTGDGMMVFLGDPVPVDRSASKAVALALDMQRAGATLSAYWARRGIQLGLSIGIAKGYATVGAIGFEGRIDYGAIGTVTNLACRLCQRAGAGEILLSQRVQAEIDDEWTLDDLGDIALPGFARPARVFRLPVSNIVDVNPV